MSAVADPANRLAEPLASFLSTSWNATVVIKDLSIASAGARRINALFTAIVDGEPQRLAATVLPTMDIELNPIDVEAATRTLARANGVPVPATRAVCTDAGVLGGPFFVSDFMSGETVPRRLLRLVAERSNGEVIGRQLGEAFARLHAIPVGELPPGLPLVEGDHPAEAALADVERAVSALLQKRPVLAHGLRWLERHLPARPARTVLLHTDVRTGNIIVDDDGLRAILDWEGAKGNGDPMQDLAWPALRMWRFRNDALEIGGFSDRRTMTDAYAGAGGAYDAESYEWWKVMGTLRWATGLANQAAGHLDGTFSGVVMAASGRRVSELEWDLLMLTKP